MLDVKPKIRGLDGLPPELLNTSLNMRTNNSKLEWVLSFKNSQGRVAMWTKRLQECDFQMDLSVETLTTNTSKHLVERCCWKYERELAIIGILKGSTRKSEYSQLKFSWNDSAPRTPVFEFY